jgi:hypothetical protein
MIVQLEGALNQAADVDGLLLRGSGPRELEKILDDASGAAGLPVREIELAFNGFIGAHPLAQ